MFAPGARCKLTLPIGRVRESIVKCGVKVRLSIGFSFSPRSRLIRLEASLA